jgi:hypothetical protein
MKKLFLILVFFTSLNLYSRNDNCDLNIDAIDEKYFTKMVNLSKKPKWDNINKSAFVDFGKGRNINIRVSPCVSGSCRL